MDERYKIINGNNLEVLDTIEENSIDSIITDPPYELGFMGKGWDKTGIAYNVELWKKALRVLKPGAYLLAFGGTRTFHRIACAIEDAGFEIRDCIMWLYGSGFPKSHDLGNGWGTSLKPAYEPIIMARKPCKGTCADNVRKYGVGGINVDECRIETTDVRCGGYSNKEEGSKGTLGWITQKKEFTDGRFPANVILTYDDKTFPEVCGDMPNNNGSVARYFYCAKTTTKDRDEGNTHPTVKPTALMQYLIRLVNPKDSIILDIFNGSGSTGKAVVCENAERNANYKYIGIEVNPEYCEISKKRIQLAESQQLNLFNFIEEK